MVAVRNMAAVAETSTDTVPPIATPVKRQAVLPEEQAGSAHTAAKLLMRDKARRIAAARVRFDSGQLL